MEFSARILQYMAERGTSAYKIAKETGISQSTFSKWKRNPTSKVSMEIAGKIADYFGITIQELLDPARAQELAAAQLQDGLDYSGLSEESLAEVKRYIALLRLRDAQQRK